MAKRFFFRRNKESKPSIQEYSLPKFRGIKPVTRYEMIIEWYSADKKFTYQRLGFKLDEGTIVHAVAKADKLAKLLSSIGNRRPDVDKRQFCRIVAVYAAHAYKDWGKEVALTTTDNKSHIGAILARAKAEKAAPKKPTKSITFIKVR